jgi:hypothetical protein
MADIKTAKFQFGSKGLTTKESGTQLTDGQYRSISNVEVKQEGSISSRSGMSFLGSTPLSSGQIAYAIQKLVNSPGEAPETPASNLRYFGLTAILPGLSNALWRTVNYTVFTKVANYINTLAGGFSKAFKLAAYAAGNVGGSWAFIASELQMLKDNGNAPYSSTLPNGNVLHNWGILPAAGVALASAYDNVSSQGRVISVVFTAGRDDCFIPYGTWTTSSGASGTGASGTFTSQVRSGDTAGSLTSFTIVNPGNGYSSLAANQILFQGGGGIVGNPGQSTLVFTVGGTGDLNGGTSTSPSQSTAYDYRFTYLATDTNAEGNPSQTMLTDSAVTQSGFGGDGLTYSGQPISVCYEAVKVLVYGSTDPQIAKINIYRRGGLLYDAWRLVGSVNNPGTFTQVSFIDSVADVDLEPSGLLETDNDPPVPSAPSNPLTGSFSGSVGAGVQTVSLSLGYLTNNNTAGGTLINAGTLVHLNYNNPEDVIIQQVVSRTQFVAFFQHNHPQDPNGHYADYEIDTLCNQACFTVVPYQQFLLVAGDPNNPHYLYRSKGDQPESFSVSPTDGSVSVVTAGTPSNPIQDICIFRGQIVTLNLYSIFETLISEGSLFQPVQVGNRGVVGRRAWCQTDTEIWFLAVDGVYSWDGGNLRKRSESIDSIFHGGGTASGATFGQEVNGFPPLDTTNWAQCQMENVRGEIHLVYEDTVGNLGHLICEPRFGDRWRPFVTSFASIIPGVFYTEPDTGSMVGIASVTGGSNVDCIKYDQEVIQGGINYTSDLFTTDPTTQGYPIPFSITLPWFDFGAPETLKVLEEVLLDLDVTGNTATGSLSIDVLQNFSDTAVSTITVPLPLTDYASGTNTGRKLISLLPGMQNVSPPTVYGQQGRSFSYRIYGSAYPARMTFFSLIMKYCDVGAQTTSGATDWMNLGCKFDKKLYQMTVEFDTQGIDQTIVMDVRTGRDSSLYGEAIQSFRLNCPVINGPSRALKTFPIADGIIVKEVRLRPSGPPPTGFTYNTASTLFFRILNVDFVKEDYPPDICAFTPWEDGGYEYDKYANQIDLEVNTNNYPITVNVQADGSNVTVGGIPWTFTVTTTESDRRRNVTLPPGLVGKKWRLFVNTTQSSIASSGGMFQLFSHRFSFQNADKGEVAHSMDWDDLGHPYDKYLRTVTVEWDLSLAPGGTQVILQLDIINGIGGGTEVSSVGQFTLTGNRSKATFPLSADLIAKLIRLYPVTSPLPIGFKEWKYSFEKTDYPPDIIYTTDWKVAQGPNEENPSWLWLDIDTANVPASVNLVNESGVVAVTANHRGTIDLRKNSYPIPADNFGRMWRLVMSNGVGGKIQVFDWGVSRWAPFSEGSPETPPDNVLWTPFQLANSQDQQNPNWVWVDMDTAAVGASIQLVSNNGVAMTFLHFGVPQDRKQSYPVPVDTFGQMWRLLITPGTNGKSKLYNWGISRWKPYDLAGDEIPPLTVLWTPWRDAETSNDKNPTWVVVDANTGGIAASVQLVNESGAQFTFSHTGTADSRKSIYAIPADLFGKMWRLLIAPGSGGFFQLFQWGLARWAPFEEGGAHDPPEVLLWTPWNTFGHPYAKTAKNLILTVDTEGANASVKLQTGESGTVETFTVNTTYDNRRVVFPIPADTVGKQWRLLVTPTGKFKLWDWSLDKIDYPADSVLFTEWKDAQTNDDKNPTWVWVDADTGGVAGSVALMNENGNVFSFSHTGTVTSRKVNYAIPADIFGKMWRLIITPGSNGRFQLFDWGIMRWSPFEEGGAIDPPDQILWTPWNSFGWPYEKIARNLIMTADTEGSVSIVNLQTGESGTVASFNINTSYDDRRVVLACPSNLIGTQWRLLISASPTFKLWDWSLDCIKEPAAVTWFDTYEQTLGYKFWKLQKQFWLMYSCSSYISATITTDTGVYSFVLPPHATRAEERMLLPSVFGLGLNKTRIWRLQLSSSSSFKLYQEGSGVEFLPLGADRHASYKQMTISEMMTLGEGGD